MDAATISTINTTVTVVGFIATIASLILAVGAIWLSIVFYKMSDAASKETTTAAKDIKASVERLENLFDKLYSDTFSMMKDTVTDMRQHIWSKPSRSDASEQPVDDDKINALKNSISQEIISIVDDKLKASGANDSKIKELEDKIKQALESSIQKTIRDQALPNAITRRRVLGLIRRNKKIGLESLLRKMNAMYPEEYSFENGEFMNILFSLRENNLITWDGPPTRISSNSTLKYIDENEGEKESN
ncbi:hypothetical protein CS018_003468 [Escherichia coli]|nr:hypothetical protein [Escherichia coli]